MGLRKRYLWITVGIIVLLQGGCWNLQEVESLAFVSAVGVDRAQESEKVQVTVQIARPTALAVASTGGSSLERAFWLVSSTGYTVFDAVRNFASQSSRRLYWPHNRWLVFGEAQAREGLEDVLDFFDRDVEARRTMKLAVVQDGMASEFLETEQEMERLASKAYEQILDNSRRGLSTVVDIDLHQFLLALVGEGIEPVAIRVEMIDRLPDVDIRGQVERRYVSLAPRVTGAAVFKGAKLVGWLNKPETRGYNWVMGKANSGIIVIERPEGGKKLAGLELLRASSKVKPELVDGKFKIVIEVKADANIGDIQDILGKTNTLSAVASMERRMATVISNEIEAVFRKTQRELASDIFGFGRAIRRKYPKEWASLRDNWNDQGFQELQIETKVSARIRHTGLGELGLSERR